MSTGGRSLGESSTQGASGRPPTRSSSQASAPGGALTLEEAARQLGVHYMTVYRYVRLGRLNATQHGGRWFVRPEDLDRLAPSPPPAGGRRRRTWEPRQERLVSRLVDGDALGCWAIVEQAMTAGASPTDVYLRLLAPALRLVGDQWKTGVLDVGDEHRATAVALRLMGRLGPSFTRSGRRRPGAVLFGGAQGDPHLIPAAMVTDVLRGAGRTVIDLGANVPQSSFLLAASRAQGLAAVGVSVSADLAKPAAAATLRALHTAHPTVLLLAGGPAVGSLAEARDLGAHAWAPDAVAVAERLEGIGG